MKKYKTILPILFILFFFSTAQSQEGYNYLNLSGGASLNEAYNFKVGIERSNERYNGWELYFEGYSRDEIKNWMAGLAYKKNLYRGRNLYSTVNFGVQGGTDESIFKGGVNAGFDVGYYFADNLAFFITNKNDFIFGGGNEFRHFLMAGFKIPF